MRPCLLVRLFLKLDASIALDEGPHRLQPKSRVALAAWQGGLSYVNPSPGALKSPANFQPAEVHLRRLYRCTG